MHSTRLLGARTHNLKGVDLALEPGTLVVLAGPSGAGKSSLAFGTLYAEGQRRYVESFSAYARQFLERLARPPVDALDPVPVAIAVDRQAPVRTSRSTVGTMTELTDYLKVLWARLAELHCARCGKIVRRDTPEAAAARVVGALEGQRIVVTYPVAVRDAEQFLGVRDALVEDGYRRILVNGEARDLDSVKPSEVVRASRSRGAGGSSAKAVEVDVVADRTVAAPAERQRIAEALEAAMARGQGRADVFRESERALRFSDALRCEDCAIDYAPSSPGLFSFNSPVGACPACRGFGRVIALDLGKVIPDESVSLRGGAVRPWTGKSTGWERKQLEKHAKLAGVPLDVPVAELTPAQRAWLVDGDEKGYPKGFFGVRAWFKWLEERAYKMHVRVLLARYRKYDPCDACGGGRLRPEALAWKVGGRSFPELLALPVAESCAEVERWARAHADDRAVALLAGESLSRLRTLIDVGLSYLSLDRQSRTLSGGEAQRVSLTGALGASLDGALFVLDEPTVGLHPRDVAALLRVVRRLGAGDNVAMLVEHHDSVIRAADRVVELGPGAGEHGGSIVFDGPPADLLRADTATGRALRGLPVRERRPHAARGVLRLRGARGHNLKGDDLEVPIGAITCVTGPSGSGKSTLVLETLEPAAARVKKQGGTDAPLAYDALEGAEALRGVLGVDQSALGRTSRGNAATYLKIWDVLRKRLATTDVAVERGYGPGFFSFNVPGGRCEACRGEGAETVEMQFLADVTFSCPECGGRRFAGEVLDVKLHGLSAADLMDLSADRAAEVFADDALVTRALAPLRKVGLGYLRLGQPLSALSGGEAQRLKLAAALAGAPPGSLIVLDEPTAGLHPEDVTPLLAVFDELVARGDTLVIVEHNMRVAAHADRVVELGPGAGEDGGRIVAAGTPEEVAASSAASAPFLARARGRSGARPASAPPPRPEADAPDGIRIEGAREHNLKEVSLTLPRGRLVAMTGPSGSGKSSLAFDVLFSEGQRRYLETLSPYARQYMPQLPRAAVDRVLGIPPSVSLEQRITRGGITSTVATVTEVAHYLRLLYARAGTLHCPDCKVPIEPRPAAALVEEVPRAATKRASVTVLAPVVRGRKGTHKDVFAKARKEGVVEARVDGALVPIAKDPKLERYKEHDVDLVLGRVRGDDPALDGLVRRALARGDGAAFVAIDGDERLLSTKRSCAKCGRGFPELDPRFFSANTRKGQCPTCEGQGVVEGKVRGRAREDAPVVPCGDCGGTRLSPLARSVTVAGHGIDALFARSVDDAHALVRSMVLPPREATIAKVPLEEAGRRLAFLERLGLGYLALDRPASTLSGGELQRVRLSAQLGAGLTGVLYVLDEPTIGLHPRDTHRLVDALRGLVDRGCSVLVVEHDTDVIRAADHVVDVGPGGGHHGGRIVAQGSPREVAADPRSATGRALARPVPRTERRDVDPRTPRLVLEGATQHNLKGERIEIPLGRLTSVTGVSGSGKSTLVRSVMLPLVRRALGLVTETRPAGTVRGTEGLARAVEVDQSPIGRTPRSVPATYVGVWDELRRCLAGTPLARARGYGPARFSFNVEGGRCPECKGQGAIVAEMAFLPEVLVPCERCAGARFGADTLDVKLHGLSAGRILDLEVEEAASVFSALSKVERPLALMRDLGLGYLKLGQASNTLSGGEAQRVKLVAELAQGSSAGPTLYVLDEPTTGLHREDVDRLLAVLRRLVDRGDTVVVIEHQTDVILASDHVIDLGPEGGAGGGRVVVAGAPEVVAAHRESRTGAILARELAARDGRAA